MFAVLRRTVSISNKINIFKTTKNTRKQTDKNFVYNRICSQCLLRILCTDSTKPPGAGKISSHFDASVNNGTDASKVERNDKSLGSAEYVEQMLEGAQTPPADDFEGDADFPSDYSDRENYHRQTDRAWERSQSKHSYRPQIDPQETSILLFPGQGSQFVGMGNQLLEYPGVQDMYDRASHILGYDLLELCLHGPKSELDKTVYCQPAILVTSLAAIQKLKYDHPKAIEHCISTAGFSVGEFASLAFAGALHFDDAIKLVKVRAEAMQAASELCPSGMMTVFLTPQSELGKACEAARHHCARELSIDEPVCQVANYLYTECKVVAGNMEALDFIEINREKFGIRRTKKLPVSGAFHTRLMQPAKSALKKALLETNIHKPIINVHSNVTSRHYSRPDVTQKMLLDQLCKPVKWEQILHVIYSRRQDVGFPSTYELGPGKQLAALLKMTNKKAAEFCTSVEV